MKKKITSILTNTALLLFSLLLAVIIAEITLPFLKIRTIEEAVYQARRPVVQAIYGEYHPQLRFTLQKSLRNIRIYYPDQLDYILDTNRYGFRGQDWDLSPARKNVILLGDSFAFGWGVAWSKTAGKVLESKLQKIDPAYQVINLAIPGYSITEVTKSLEIFGKMLKPVAMIYLFCPNDIDGMVSPVSPGVYDIDYHPAPEDEASFKGLVNRNQPDYWSWNKFYRKSYGKAFHARLIRPLFSNRIKQSMRVDRPPAGFDFTPPVSPAGNPPHTPEANFIYYCLQRMHDAFPQTEFYLTTTSDKSILVKQDNEKNLRWVLRSFSIRTPGAFFVDFENFARITPGSRKLFLDYDDHWSAEGHAAAADILFNAMTKTLPHHTSAKNR